MGCRRTVDATGPREWQRDALTVIGAHLSNPETRHKPLRIAVASGHGIGSRPASRHGHQLGPCRREDCRVVVTANTESQLVGSHQDWPEISKWARLSLTAAWWKNVPAMSLYSA